MPAQESLFCPSHSEVPLGTNREALPKKLASTPGPCPPRGHNQRVPQTKPKHHPTTSAQFRCHRPPAPAPSSSSSCLAVFASCGHAGPGPGAGRLAGASAALSTPPGAAGGEPGRPEEKDPNGMGQRELIAFCWFPVSHHSRKVPKRIDRWQSRRRTNCCTGVSSTCP